MYTQMLFTAACDFILPELGALVTTSLSCLLLLALRF